MFISVPIHPVCAVTVNPAGSGWGSHARRGSIRAAAIAVAAKMIAAVTPTAIPIFVFWVIFVSLQMLFWDILPRGK